MTAHLPPRLLSAAALIELAGWPVAGLAQETGPDDEDRDDRAVIVVTGAALPPAVSDPAYGGQVITRETLIAAPSGRLEVTLANVAGFQQFRRSDSRSANPSAQGATLRALGGNAASRALVLLDGVPMADPFFGFVPFTALAPERLGSVRVTRGGGSGPFGAGALAGTIELTSLDARDADAFAGHALVNDRGDIETTAQVSSPLGGGFASLAGRLDSGPGFFTTPPADRSDASVRARFDSFSVQARGVVPVGADMELQARGLVYDDRRTLRFEGADSSSTGQDASLRLISLGSWPFEALAYVQARNFTNTVISSTRFVPVLDQRNTPSTGLGGKIEIRPPVGHGIGLRLGADYRRSDGELYETAISAFTGAVRERRNAGGTNSDLGLYAEADRIFGPLTVTGGVRTDQFAIEDGFFRATDATGTVIADETYAGRDGWDASWRAGVLLDAGGGVSLRAAGYTGLRLPTLNELYRPFVIFPVTTQANAALRNERLEGIEAGIEYSRGGRVRISLTAFDNRVKDAIANVTLDEVTRQRQNIAAIEARGLEADGSLDLGRFSIVASLAYTDAKTRQPGAAFDGKRPSQSATLSGGASLAYRFAERGRLALQLRHVSDQFEDDLETDVLPAVTTLGAYAQVPVGKSVSIVLRAENLTDEDIVTRNQRGSIDLGVPRTVWAGIRIAR